jgi:phosphatidylinositol 4-kinase
MLAVLTLDDEDSSAGSSSSLGSGGGWTLMSLSLISTILHILIVLHVRSTGPNEDGLYEEKRKRKRLAYAVGGRLRKGKASNDNNDDDNDMTDQPFLLSSGAGGSKINRLNKSLKERLMCLPETFLNDTQARFDAAQRMWSDRLEVMTHSLQHQSNMSPGIDNRQHNNYSREEGGGESTNLIAHALNSAATNASKLAKPDPFRVLLQLFAYEDVWSGTNNRLDLAFSSSSTPAAATPTTGGGGGGQSHYHESGGESTTSSEGNSALAFYAPQLLSFLLHGAYFDISSKLEEWILKKCGEDLHFAHRCFWFLRSWCLEGGRNVSSVKRQPSHTRSLSSGSFGGLVSLIDLPLEIGGGGNNNRLRGVESNLYLSSSGHGTLPPAVPLLYSTPLVASGANLPGSSTWDSYSNFSEADRFASSKFSPEEQELIEQLLHRVVEQGSRPATVAQYGSVDGHQDGDDYNSGFTYSPSALATAMEQGLVPFDPRTGSHSMAHLDCITSSHNHGFLPLNDNSGEPYQPIHPTNDADRLFFAAPLFLDALLSIADDLMNTSRPNRTTELRSRLRSLEVELLPSNVVYLPIQNMDHRVWRICADESLALSTNERVPCIITLEVIDYGVSSPTTSKSSVGTDSITLAWVHTPRHPQRHGTIIDKVANYTQEGLKRLEDTIDRSFGDGRPVLDRRLSEILGMRDNSWTRGSQMYTSVHSFDDEDNESNHAGEEEQYNVRDEEAPEFHKLGVGESSLRTSDMTEIGSQNEEEVVPQSLMPDVTDEMPSKHRLSPTLNTPNSDSEETSPMGQWSTPKKKNVILKQRPIGGITIPEFPGFEEEESDNEFSPQAKNRQMVPPSTTIISLGQSLGDETRFDGLEEPEDREVNVLQNVKPTVVFKEDWKAKTERVRQCSLYGSHPGWRLLPILIKSNDDLRQEQLASQLIHRMATILAKARVPVWLFPYEIVALTGRGGIIECVPDTISLDSLKRNDPDFTSLKSFFIQHFGHPGSDELADAKANFVESLAAYSIVCFLMQIKDRHNGNILLDNKGHIIHIDFGFYFLSSPGKNSGFESAPFKLTRDFVSLMDGPSSRTFQKFRELCYKTFIELRKHCYQIILLVEMIVEGNEDLACFRSKPDEAVRQLKERFRLDLNDNGVRKYVDSLIDESIENWRTRWYDRYQRFCVGVM